MVIKIKKKKKKKKKKKQKKKKKKKKKNIINKPLTKIKTWRIIYILYR